jgi:hypothetical protein
LHWKGFGLVGTAQQVLGHNPLKIFFLALDAAPRAPVRLDRQECDDRINIASLDNPAALRSLELVEDVVVDIVDVVRASIVSGDTDMSRTAHCQLINHHESVGNDAAASFQRAGYQGCRISPPDLAMALMAVVHAAHPKFWRNAVRKSGIGPDHL